MSIKKIVTSQQEGSSTGTNAAHDPNSFVYDDNGLIRYKKDHQTPAQRFMEPGVVYGSGYEGGENGGRPVIKLRPDEYASQDQQVVIDATAPDHIHIRAGGVKDGSNAVLILGAETTNVEVSDLSGTVVINSNNGQFLQNGSSENQIATLGDIGVETVFTVVGGSTGDAPTFTGDPLFTGSYIRMSSDLVHFQIQVDFDNITSFGTGQYYVDLPFPAKYGYKFREGCLHDISATKDYAIGGHVFAGESRLYLSSTDTQSGTVFDIPFTSSAPVALNVADNFHIAGTYIADTSAP